MSDASKLIEGLRPLPPRDSSEAECDVLISGAGPTGLLLGCHLRELGIDAVIVDPHLGPGNYSKAALTVPRSWEMLDLCRVTEPLLKECRTLSSARAGYGGSWVKTAAGFANQGIASRFQPCTLGQNYVEAHLDKRFVELGGRMYRGARFLGIAGSGGDGPHQTDDGGVSAEVERFIYCRPPAQPPQLPPRLQEVPDTTFRAKFLVGCDGRQSAVRKELGVAFPGKDYPQRFILSDVEMEDDGTNGLEEHEFYFMLDESRVLLMVHLQGKIWRVYHSASDIEPEDATTENLERIWREMFPDGMIPETVKWKDPGYFSLSCCLADTYRSGRCLLAGDAAHCHSPAGGQGMNTGLQDSGNLAWKLAAVLKGRAPASLLDSYEPERKPVAEWVLATSDSIFGAVTSSSSDSGGFFGFFVPALRQAFLRLLLPLVPSSLLPPPPIKERMMGLSITYAGAGTCIDSGSTPPNGASAAGGRLPDCTFQLLPDGSSTTLLQLLRPLSLKIRLLFVGPAYPSSAELKEVLAKVEAVTAWPELEAWAVCTNCDGSEAPNKAAAAAPPSVDGYECKCLGGNAGAEDLSRQLKLPKGQRALLVVRPDGYVAVSHRGGDEWGAEAVAQGMADCGLSAPKEAA